MKKISIIVRLGVVAAVTAFLFWRCRYGIANIDECFNLSLAYRLWQGDALLVDMWDLQQFFGVVMLPLAWLYMKVVGTTDGLILNLRYLFVMSMIGMAAFHYVRWRSYDERGAYWGSVAFALTCPFSLNNFTYNSVGVLLFSLVITLYATNERKRLFDSVLCGIAYSASVLCCPFLVLAFPFFAFACWYRKVIVREGVPFVSGCCLVGAAVFALIFSRASLGDIIASVPNFFGDNEHANRSLLIIIRDWGGHFLLVQGAWSFVALAAAGVIFAYQRWFDKKCFAHDGMYRKVYFLIGFILLGEAIVLRPWPDFPVLPASVMALLAMGLARDSRLLSVIWLGVVPAFIYGFCICAGSNQGSFVISSVLAASVVPACVVVSSVFGKVSRKLVVAFFVVQVIGVAYGHYHIVFWDAPMQRLTTTIKKGPHRGLVTTQSKASLNESVVDLTRQCLKNGDGVRVYFQLKSLWQAFVTDNRVGSYSLWVTDMKEEYSEHEFMARMDKYYEMHPGKIPNLVGLEANSLRTIEHFKRKYGFEESARNEYMVILKR